MKRPTDKLLKDMSNEELREESAWHSEEAERLFAEVRGIRTKAIKTTSGEESMRLLLDATETEKRADAHIHHSRVLLAACRPTDAHPAPKLSATGS